MPGRSPGHRGRTSGPGPDPAGRLVPCGPRPDKPTTNDVDPIHRAIMGDLTFRNLDRVRVELFDLEQLTFSKTHELDERFREDGEPWHVRRGLASRPPTQPPMVT